MKRIKNNVYIAITALCLFKTLNGSNCSGCINPKTIFVPRAQSVNAAQHMVGTQLFINKYQAENFYGSNAWSIQFHQSLNGDQIADYFFGPAVRNGTITFSGSQVLGRGQTDILADYFGLPPDLQSTVCFNPQIQNFIIDTNLFYGLDHWIANTYITLYLQLCCTRWAMNGTECITQTGTSPFARGYMSKNSAAPGTTSALTALNGCTPFGDNQQGIQFGKIANSALTRTRIPDINFAWGWNFFNRDRGHIGLNIQSSIPTGNKPTGEFLFEPIVGNGRHFTLGAGLTSHWILFDNEEDKFLGIYMNANINHLFTTNQVRSFDFKNFDVLNRYILLAQFKQIPQDRTGHLNVVGLNYEYADKLVPAVNLTTQCCQVSVGIEADLAWMLGYHCKNWDVNIGYNFWGKSKEKITRSNDTFKAALVALKGDTFLYGVATNDIGSASGIIPTTVTSATIARTNYPKNAIALSAGQNFSATIFSGGNNNPQLNISGTSPTLNPIVDNPELATACISLPELTNCITEGVAVISPVTNAPITQINTSNPICFLSDADLDVTSAAAPSAISHKIFIHGSYTWKSFNNCIVPFVGAGGEVEFSGNNSTSSTKNCDCPAALAQWGIWIKGGIAF